jgi:hypothetical protein
MPTPAPRTTKVTMPDGTVLKDVPVDITQDELWDRYTAMQMQTPKTPIDVGLATQERKTALLQAQRQQEWEARQAEIAKFEAEHPEAKVGSDIMREPVPAVNPYLQYSAPELPASPVQKFKSAAKMGLLEDETRMRQIMARDLFPNDPNAMDRVGFLDGVPVYTDDDGNLQQLSSGRVRFLANMTANSPEMVAGLIGSFGGPGTAAGMTAGAHGIKRGIASLIFNEPTTPLQNLKGMAIEGGLSFAGEIPGLAAGALGNRGTFVNMTPKQLKAAQEVQRRIKQEQDIDLDIAQASGNRKLISARKYLARNQGESADIFQELDERALDQLHARQDKVLDTIATATPAEIAEAGGVNAADAALRTARREISAKVRPYYNAAYEKNPVINDPELLAFLKLPYFKEAYNAGQEIARLEEKGASTVMTYATKSKRVKHSSGKFRVTQNEVTEIPIEQPDLRSLDYLKQGLDEVIEKLKDAKQFKRAGALQKQRDAFVEQLDTLPSGEYQRARQEYAKLRAAILTPLERGPVGVLAKLKDKDAVGAAAKVFGDADVTESQIALAKRAIQAENPEAWNDLTRAWLSDVFEKTRTESQTGVALNPAGKSRQILYGNKKRRAKMAAILPPGSVKMFDDLMDASRMLSSTPLSGSNTAVDMEFKEILKGRALPIFKWLTSFRKQAVDTAERAAIEQGSKEMALAMTDPTKIKHIKRVLRMKPSTEQAILLSTIAAARTGAEALRTAYPDEEDSPNFAQ